MNFGGKKIPTRASKDLIMGRFAVRRSTCSLTNMSLHFSQDKEIKRLHKSIR